MTPERDALNLAKEVAKACDKGGYTAGRLSALDETLARALIDTSARLEHARKAIEDAPCGPGCLSRLRPGTPPFLPCNCAWKASALADIGGPSPMSEPGACGHRWDRTLHRACLRCAVAACETRIRSFVDRWRAVLRESSPSGEDFGNSTIARIATEALADIGPVVEPSVSRDNRQKIVFDWCAAAFGEAHATSIPQRGIRLAEEAIEAAQASGCPANIVHRLIDHIYAKPAGTLNQEIGGVGITLLALAQAAGLSADDEEAHELGRVLAKPLAHFATRNKAKSDAGFNLEKPQRCPTCDSPQPHLHPVHLHPAMQCEGEVQPCNDHWHEPHGNILAKRVCPRCVGTKVIYAGQVASAMPCPVCVSQAEVD